MDASAIALAIAVLESLPSLVLASQEVLALMKSTVVSLRRMQSENRDPTDAEWDSLNSVIATLNERVQS